MTARHWTLDIGHWTFPALLAALGGFLLPLQTVWIFRPGMLGGIPWPLATIGLYASDVVLLFAAVIGSARVWRTMGLPPTPPLQGEGEQKKFSPLLVEGERPVPRSPEGEVGEGVARRARIASVLLIMLAAVNTLMSADPWLSAVGWVRIIAFLLALVGIPSWSSDARRAFLGGFLIAMLGHVVLGLLQFATGHGFASTLLGTAAHDAFINGDSVITAPGERWLRAYGGFPHPNVFGTALLVAMVALAQRPARSFIICARGASALGGHHSSFIILTFALVLTFSRAALLGLIVLLIVLAIRAATRSLALTGTLALIATLAVTASFWTPRITGSTLNEQRSFSERSKSIEAAIAFGSTPPYLGVGGLHGMPKVLWEFRPYLREHTVTPWTWAQPTHNVPLLAIAEIGIVGVLILALVLVLLPLRQLFPHTSYLFPLLPSLLFDHHLWSLPVGLALLFVLAIAIHRPVSSVDDAGAELHTRSVRVPSQ